MSQSLLLNITTYCNALCEFCIVYDSLNKPELNMTDEQIFGALDKARTEGTVEVGYSGGEPSVHPRFVEFVQYATDAGFERQSINTNGLKFRKQKYCQEVIEAGMTSVDFSIHGYTDEVHDKLVARKGALQAIKEACGHLVELRKIHKFHLSATTVITRDNYRQLRDICVFLDELGFENIRLKYAYEGDLRHEAIINQVVPYEEVIPSILEALDYMAKRPGGFHVTHIPLCLLGTHAAFSNDFHRRSTLMVFRKEAVSGDAAHRFRKDGDACTRCQVRNLCTRLDGAYEEYHGRPDLVAFESHEEVEAMFQAAVDKYPIAATIIRYTHDAYNRNREAIDPKPVAVPVPVGSN